MVHSAKRRSALYNRPQKEVALIREGGRIQSFAIPHILAWRRFSSASPCRLPAHSPNEISAENLEAGIKMNKAILQELGAGDT